MKVWIKRSDKILTELHILNHGFREKTVRSRMILKIHFGTNTLPNLYTQTDEKYVKNVYLTENCMVYNLPEI